MVDTGKVLRLCGLAAVLVGFGGVLVATVVSPAFSWTGNALSDLGVTRTAAGTPVTAVLFNASLVIGGVVGLGFGVTLAREAHSRGRRVVAWVFGLTVSTMALIGVFPMGTTLHVPVATGFYLLVTVLCWTDGVVALAGRLRRRGVGALLLGAANLGAWVVWSAGGSVSRPGVAVPELVGALAFSAWVVWRWQELSHPRNATNH
jgi:hypothetical membrane protein